MPTRFWELAPRIPDGRCIGPLRPAGQAFSDGDDSVKPAELGSRRRWPRAPGQTIVMAGPGASTI
ncbi:MAG TPA: hypothetical protein VGP46_07330, partial [Acidimicrobiales bacterium]|nr:hypothetical protein [Acidimicrobiales bacterium]